METFVLEVLFQTYRYITCFFVSDLPFQNSCFSAFVSELSLQNPCQGTFFEARMGGLSLAREAVGTLRPGQGEPGVGALLREVAAMTAACHKQRLLLWWGN